MTRQEAWDRLVVAWKAAHPGDEVFEESPKEGYIGVRPKSIEKGYVRRQVWLWAQQQYVADMPEEEYPLALATGAGGHGGNSDLAREVMRARLKEVEL